MAINAEASVKFMNGKKVSKEARRILLTVLFLGGYGL
jgi:hypothetical protein